MEKGSKKTNHVEKLSYQLVKAYLLDRSSKRQEAVAEVDEVIKEITDSQLLDYDLLNQAEILMSEMGCFDRIL